MRIFIADNQGVLRAGLRALLCSEPGIEIVGEASDGEQAAIQVERTRPDLVLAEIQLPALDGISLTRRLRETLPSTRVLILSVFEDNDTLWKALRAGAIGYVPKRATGAELLQAVRSAAQGDFYIHPAMVHCLIQQPVKNDPLQIPPNRVLSAREMDVLRLLVLGYTNREMANALHIGVRTVETHRANLMEKLGLHSRGELVRYANRYGFELQASKNGGKHPD